MGDIQKVNVKLTTTTEQQGDVSTTKMSVDGGLEKFDNKYTLELVEEQDEGKFQIILDVHKTNEILLNRKSFDGTRLTNIYFSEGKRNNIILRTEYGEIVDLDCYTKKIVLDENSENDSGEIYVAYQIFQKENLIGDYQIKLIFNK